MAIKQILGLYEKNVRNVLKNIRGDCFFDVGANTGFYSLLLRHNFRQVYAIEPVPTSARRLKRRLSTRNGRATFYVNSDSSTIIDNLSASSLFEKFEFRSCDNAPDRTYTGSPISVETITFDSLLSEPSADLVKIDVEGAEFLVLEGMRESFAKQRVRNILVELHDRDRKEELETVLKSNLAHVFWVDNQHIYGSRDTAVSTRGNPVEFL